MNKVQTAHQDRISKAFVKEHYEKFRNGTIEHSGNLQDVPAKQLVEFAIEEVLDLASYLYTLRETLEYHEE